MFEEKKKTTVDILPTDGVVVSASNTVSSDISKDETAKKNTEQEIFGNEFLDTYVSMNEEIVKLKDRSEDVVAEIDVLVQQGDVLDRKGRAKKVDRAQKNLASISSQSVEAIEQGTQLYADNEAELIQLDDKVLHFDEALVAKKIERRDAFKRVADMLEALLVDAAEIVKSFDATTIKKEHSVKNNDSKEKAVIETIPEIGTVARSNGNFEVLKKVREVVLTTDPVVGEVAVPKIVESKKPEAPADLQRALDNLWEEISTIIDAISTPEEYAAFRKGMNIVLTEDGQVEKRYFFQMRVVEKLTGRKVEKEENLFVATLTRELEEKAQDKFLALMDADLRMQYDREQAKIDEVKDESALDELEIAWKRKLNIALTWESNKVIFDNLSEKEQKKVRINYLNCAAVLSQSLQIKREKFRRPRIEIKNKFNDVVREKRRSAKELIGDSSDEASQRKCVDYIGYLDRLVRDANSAFERKDIEELRVLLGRANGAVFKLEEPKKEVGVEKELTNEELFAILAEALKSKRKSLGKDNKGKELVIEKEDVSDTAIKYRYGEANVVTTPADVKDLLNILKEDYGWEPGVLSKRRVASETKEAEKIMAELGVVISEKKALFEAESTKVSASSEVLTRNMAYLDRLTSDAQAAFFVGDMRGLRVILEKAKKAEFRLEITQDKSAVSSRPKRGRPFLSSDVNDARIDEDDAARSSLSRSALSVEEIQALDREKAKEALLKQKKSEPEGSKEKRYKELRLLMDQSEMDELIGVTGTGLKEVLMHSRNTGKSKKEAAEETGMDFIIEELLVPAIKEVLPSGWSDEDKEIFSRALVLKRIEIFISERPKK